MEIDFQLRNDKGNGKFECVSNMIVLRSVLILTIVRRKEPPPVMRLSVSSQSQYERLCVHDQESASEVKNP